MRGACARTLVAVICAPLLSAPSAVRRPLPQRIYGGVDDTENKYPYVVALLFLNIRKCSGTLIAPSWVLTAAHCDTVTSVQFGNMSVSPKDITSDSELLKWFPHHGFRRILGPGKIQNDIALMLVEKVALDVYGSLAGIDYRAMSGMPVVYAGFGNTRKKAGIYGLIADLTRPLQLGGGVVVSCDAYGMFTQCVCVVPRCRSTQTVLPGDSGGPLLLDGKVVGVAHDRVKRPRVSMFMPVSPYLSWIHQIMKKEEQTYKKLS